MRCIPAVLVLLAAAASAVPGEVAEIDAYLDGVTDMIEDHGILVERSVVYIHETIPAIGMPQTALTGWFDQIYYDEEPGAFDEVPLYIENIYRHAGYGAIEEYYYMPDGEMVCCIAMTANYLIEEADYSSTFYFDGGNLVYAITPAGDFDGDFPEHILQKAHNRQTQARMIYNLFMNEPVCSPPCFWETWEEEDTSQRWMQRDDDVGC
jgi:hypothetical protein